MHRLHEIRESHRRRERPHQDEKYALITARLGNENFASLKLLGDDQATWFYFRYELVGDLLRLSNDGDFWRRAVADKMLPGEIDEQGPVGRVAVTASEEELRDFVLGYGGVIFNPEVAVELQRAR